MPEWKSFPFQEHNGNLSSSMAGIGNGSWNKKVCGSAIDGIGVPTQYVESIPKSTFYFSLKNYFLLWNIKDSFKLLKIKVINMEHLVKIQIL